MSPRYTVKKVRRGLYLVIARGKPGDVPLSYAIEASSKAEALRKVSGSPPPGNLRRIRARQNSSLHRTAKIAERLLQQLQGVKVAAQLLHWNSRGPSGYSDHLLFERVYGKMDDQIDTLAEKYVSYFGQSVPVAAMMPAADFIEGYGHESLRASSLVQGLRNAQSLSDGLREGINEARSLEILPGSPAGFDDYLMSLNNELDTFIYLVNNVRGEDAL